MTDIWTGYIWFEASVLTGEFPREKTTIYEGMMKSLKAPEFDYMKTYEPFVALQKNVDRMNRILQGKRK